MPAYCRGRSTCLAPPLGPARDARGSATGAGGAVDRYNKRPGRNVALGPLLCFLCACFGGRGLRTIPKE